MAQSSQEPFYIEVNAPFGGWIPSWYKNDNVFVANKNQFSDMNSLDFRDPNCFFQGPGLAALANSASVSTLIKGITPIVASADVAFAVGGNKLYKIKSASIVATTFPMTIDHATYSGEAAESVMPFQGDVYGFYNHGNGGDMFKLTLPSTFDPDYGSTVPTGAAVLANAPHPCWIAADKLMFGNGRYVGSFDGTTLDKGDGVLGLDFKTGSVVADGCYTNNWNYVCVNFPDIAGNNANEALIYLWDGENVSWENTVSIKGRIGAILPDNGIVYVWYQEDNSDGGYKLGYILGSSIKEIESYDGSMPLYYQKTKNGNFLQWISNGKVYSWGTSNKKVVSPVLFNLMDGGLATVGGLGSPFGELIVSSNSPELVYKLNKVSGLDLSANGYTPVFDVTRGANHGMIDEIMVEFYPMEASARVDINIFPDLVLANSANVGEISNTTDGATKIRKSFYPKTECDNFKLKFFYANGSATNPVKIRKYKIFGHYLKS